MKSHQGGIHQPGIREAGEAEPTKADFDALIARVKALEDAPPAAGGKRYVLRWLGGLDASTADAPTGSQGEAPFGWKIVSVLRFQISDGLGGQINPANEVEFSGGVNIFLNPITDPFGGHNGQLVFNHAFEGGLDYTPFYFVVLIESP